MCKPWSIEEYSIFHFTPILHKVMFFSKLSQCCVFIYCGLMTPCEVMEFGKHWFKQLLVAWWQHVITWTNADIMSITTYPWLPSTHPSSPSLYTPDSYSTINTPKVPFSTYPWLPSTHPRSPSLYTADYHQHTQGPLLYIPLTTITTPEVPFSTYRWLPSTHPRSPSLHTPDYHHHTQGPLLYIPLTTINTPKVPFFTYPWLPSTHPRSPS